MRTALLLLLAAGLTACATHYTTGSVNGIEYHMSLDRPAVAGGVPWSIDIRIEPGRADLGTLRVDGVSYGAVHSGDRVRVTPEAVVLVNDEPRAASGD